MKSRTLVTLFAISAFVTSTLPAHAAAIVAASGAVSSPSVSGTNHTNDVGIDTIAATSTVALSEDPNTPGERLILVSEKKPTKNITMFVFDLKNDGEGSTALVQGVTLSVSTSTAFGSPAANITDIASKAVIMAGGRLYTGTINSNNTVSFSFANPVKIQRKSTQSFTVAIDLLPQKNNYNQQGEGMLFSVISNGVTAVDSKSGEADTINGEAPGNLQSLTSVAQEMVVGKDSSAILSYNAVDPSKSYGTFTLDVELTSVGGDLYIPKSIASTSAASTTYSGFVLDLNMGSQATGQSALSLTSNADSDNSLFWVVRNGETRLFTATAVIDPDLTGDFEVGLDRLQYSSTDTDLNHLQTLNIYQGDPQFHTPMLHIPNS